MQGSFLKRGRKWAFVLDVPSGDGSRRQKWFSGYATKKDAERDFGQIVGELYGGSFIEPTSMTVAAYLRHWLAAYARTSVSAKTYERYAEIVESNLIPALGRYQLSKLGPAVIQAFYSDQLLHGRKSGGALSARTVLNMHRVLRQALKHAVKWQLLARNPADATEPPRPRPTEICALDEAQSRALLTAAKDTELFVPIQLALATGMRRGEILALRWADVDMERAVLKVCRSVEQTHDGLSFKAPKTAKGRRQVALSKDTVESLRAHKKKQAEARLLLGPGYDNGDLVVARTDGRCLKPDSFTVAFKKFARGFGMPSLRFHDLRHTHATLLLRQGIHPKIVSERLGHATIAITLDTYSHVLPGMQAEAARLIDEALSGAIGA